MSINKLHIKKFLKNVKPLDLLLIQGVTNFSTLIMSGSEVMRGNGSFSHCGLIVNREICEKFLIYEERLTAPYRKNPDELFLMEIIVSPVGDLFEKDKDFSVGSRIVPLEEIVGEFIRAGCGVAYCALKDNIYENAIKNDDIKTINQIKEVLFTCYKQYFHKNKTVYDPNIFSLLGTIFPSVRYIRDEIDGAFEFIRDYHPWLFCSEFVCIAYRDLGILKEDIDVQNYLPIDFVHPGKDNEVYSIVKLPPVYLKRIDNKSNCLKTIFTYLFKNK